MIAKRLSDDRRFYVGPVSEIKLKGESAYCRILSPTRVGDVNCIVVDPETFKTDFAVVPQDPIIKHVREYDNTPFACLLMFGEDSFYFSRCHKKDSYCKRTGRAQALANGCMTYKEAVEKIKAQKGGGWENPYDDHIETVLTNLLRMKEYGDTYFASDY